METIIEELARDAARQIIDLERQGGADTWDEACDRGVAQVEAWLDQQYFDAFWSTYDDPENVARETLAALRRLRRRGEFEND